MKYYYPITTSALATALLGSSIATTRAFVLSPKRGLERGVLLPPPGTLAKRKLPSPSSITITSSSLHMAADDFSEQKYTEGAWSVMSSLTKAADYYEASTIEAPLMLDLLLNPSKHGASQDAEAAKKVVVSVLQKANVDVKKLQSGLDQWLSQQPRLTTNSGATQKMMSQGLANVLESAKTVMSVLGDSFVSTEAILLALAKDDAKYTNPALLKQSVKYNDILKVVKEMREKNGPVINRAAENMYDALLKYGIDFTELAREGKLDPVIGRDDEIRRAIQILSRRRKNNPCLVGDPGVGKTAVAEGIAQRIVEGDVPTNLQNKRMISLDLGALVAGATMRGEFEERLKAVVDEVVAADGEIILFIDEMHTVVGAGSAQGSMDASNLLKPALARGQLRCIGATTINEYRKYVEKDKALERRFQQVMIDEPNEEATVSILRGLKPKYELHHGIRIRDEALLAAVKLTHRYIQDRFQPDCSIDVIDEACAKLKNEITSKPTELDEIDRRIIQLEMERLSLQSDLDKADGNVDMRGQYSRLEKIDGELLDLKKQSESLNTRWMAEKGGVDRLNELKEEIAGVELEIEKYEREFELNKAAELKYSKLPELREEMSALELANEQMGLMSGERMLRDEVVADDVAAVVATWTGIPQTKLLDNERDRIVHMEDIIKERVVGQDDAIKVITEAVQRSRAGLNDPTKPIASFIFLGPTGTGKTECSKALAEFMFDTEDSLIRIDMSEYMEKHTVSRLIGSPPGYVGHEEGGQLTNAVRRKPYSVILFDEIEKAHPDVFNIMLQMLDDGRLTDSKGNTVNFRNTICIFTSNIGSSDIIELGGKDDATMRSRVNEAMKNYFKPEFLNRIDEQVIFNSLSKNNLRGIVKLETVKLEERLRERQITLRLTEDALDFLADIGYDPVYGARPLKRTIQRELETKIAKRILSGDILDGDAILIDVKDERLSIERTGTTAGFKETATVDGDSFL